MNFLLTPKWIWIWLSVRCLMYKWSNWMQSQTNLSSSELCMILSTVHHSYKTDGHRFVFYGRAIVNDLYDLCPSCSPVWSLHWPLTHRCRHCQRVQRGRVDRSQRSPQKHRAEAFRASDWESCCWTGKENAGASAGRKEDGRLPRSGSRSCRMVPSTRRSTAQGMTQLHPLVNLGH